MSEIVIHTVSAENEKPCIVSIINGLIHNEPCKDVMVIVPENMTLEYEQLLLKRRDGMMTVTIKSLKKILDTVLDIYGYGSGYKNFAPDITTRMGMIAKTYLLINEFANEMRYFKTRRISSAEKLYDTVTELKDHGYAEEPLNDLTKVESIPPLLKDKLHDICLVLRELTGTNTTEETVYEMACSQIKKHNIFENNNIIFCGFDLLTTRILRLCESVLHNADKKAHVVFLSPEKEKKQTSESAYSELDASICRAIKKYDKNKELGINIVIANEFEGEPENYQDSIKYLAARVLNEEAACPDNFNNISVYKAPNQYAECLYAVQKIIEWHEKGCPWKETGVVMDLDETTSNMLPLVMESAGVPYFIALRHSSIQNVGIDYLMNVISAANGYSRQKIVNVLRSGFLSVGEKESSRMEIYAHEHGIQGNKWTTPFSNRKSLPEIDELDAIRKSLMDPIIKLHESLADRKNNAKAQATAIWSYMNETGFYEKLKEKEQAYRNEGYNLYAEQTRQSWHVICKALNTIATETTEKHLSMDNFEEIIHKCLSNEALKSIPQTADAVLISDATTFLPGMRKKCVLISSQEKTNSKITDLLTVSEKKWMESNKHVAKVNPMFYLADEDVRACKQMIQKQYRAIMSATEELVISYSSVSHKGEILMPSTLVKITEESLKKNAPENIKGGIMDNALLPYSREITVELLAQKMRELVFYNKGDLSDDSNSDRAIMWKKAYSFLCKNKPEIIDRIMKSMNSAPGAENIPSEQAQKLFKTSVTSVSELEDFAACPYSHFVKYGLKPTDIRDYSFEADQKGIFFHAAMKSYIDKAKQDKDFPNIGQKKIIEYFNEAVRPLVEELEDTSLSENTLSRMELTEYVQTVRVSAMYVTYWLAETKYMPEGCEISFGKKDSVYPSLVLNLPGGNKVALAGTIDRYDVYTDSKGQKYGRIVDYKSSSHSLDQDAIAGGYQLQLPIYLRALTAANPGMKPSGAFYQQITNAVVETDSEDETEVRNKVMENTMLNGMYLVTENDDLEKASGGSVKKKKSTSKSVSGLTESEMEALLNTAQRKATEHAVNIEEGVISITPRDDGGKDPCEYCKSKNICLIANRKAFGGNQA